MAESEVADPWIVRLEPPDEMWVRLDPVIPEGSDVRVTFAGPTNVAVEPPEGGWKPNVSWAVKVTRHEDGAVTAEAHEVPN